MAWHGMARLRPASSLPTLPQGARDAATPCRLGRTSAQLALPWLHFYQIVLLEAGDDADRGTKVVGSGLLSGKKIGSAMLPCMAPLQARCKEKRSGCWSIQEMQLQSSGQQLQAGLCALLAALPAGSHCRPRSQPWPSHCSSARLWQGQAGETTGIMTHGYSDHPLCPPHCSLCSAQPQQKETLRLTAAIQHVISVALGAPPQLLHHALTDVCVQARRAACGG